MTEKNNEVVQMQCQDGVVHLTLKMSGKANKINETFTRCLSEAIDWAIAQPDLAGIVIGTGHKDFCVGADIDRMFKERDPAVVMGGVMGMHAMLRKLETCGKPVVALLTGSALGGGYEIALACHHRIAVDSPAVMVGLPETGLGLIPGGGGTQRLSRLIGFQGALENVLQGKIYRAPKAKAAGFVDDLAKDRDDALAKAHAFIAANPASGQPWDQKAYRWPAPTPGSRDARNLFLASCAMVRKKSAGAFRAPEAAISAIHEGAAVNFDRSLEVEARHFVNLAVHNQAKAMLRTLWYHKQAVDKQEGLPRTETPDFEKIGILGAGMMGAALAFVCARTGYQVVLKDIKPEAIEKGVQHLDAQIAKCKWLPEDEQKAIRGRVHTTTEAAALSGCDLIVEAVIENIDIKHQVVRECESQLAPNGVWASNTSAIPISDLATVSKAPDRFIGTHFFSPVEKMPLLEVIRGAGTSDETVARILTFAKKIGKTTIVVGDGYGFYTSRIFAAYISEGAQLVAEGHSPAAIEWAARSAGMAVAPLQVIDEVSLSLVSHAGKQSESYVDTHTMPGVQLMQRMVKDFDRSGKVGGRGFYDYKEGRRVGIWPGLKDLVDQTPAESGSQYLMDRLMMIQAVEAVRCLEDGVVKHPRDAEVGAILGVGFAANTGGPLTYLEQRGLREAVQILDRFEAQAGDRYRAPSKLREMAERKSSFFGDVTDAK